MAAINFPDAPTNGQIFESGGMSWTYVAGVGWTLNSAIVEAGSGFTFIADTMPLPVNVGDTWFDSSTGASGGNSYVAVEEGPAGASEKVWVQFAPGVGSAREIPAGCIQDYIGASAPGGWILLDGSTIAGADVLYPTLWMVVPAGMKSGSSLIVPDTRSRMTAGYNAADANFNAIGKVGGAATHALSIAELAVHTHVQNGHNHTQDAHGHPTVLNSTPAPAYNGNTLGYGSSADVAWRTPPGGVIAATTATNQAATATNQNTGSGAAHNNLPPFITFLKIMRAY